MQSEVVLSQPMLSQPMLFQPRFEQDGLAAAELSTAVEARSTRASRSAVSGRISLERRDQLVMFSFFPES